MAIRQCPKCRRITGARYCPWHGSREVETKKLIPDHTPIKSKYELKRIRKLVADKMALVCKAA